MKKIIMLLLAIFMVPIYASVTEASVLKAFNMSEISSSYSNMEFISVSHSHVNVTSSSFETIIINKIYEVCL